MGVYTRVPREEALADLDMKLIGARWIKVNNRTRDLPKEWCRLVAQELATTKEDDLFAETPLLALRLLLSDVASVEPGSKIVMSMDVKCAFLYGAAKRKLCIDLLPEAKAFAAGSVVGVLQR